MARGGARPGAGRPKKQRPAGNQRFDSAEEYLRAVVAGDIQADSVRVAAARTLIQYEQRKCRGPKQSPPPAELEKKAARAEEREADLEFERKAAAIRKKYERVEQ